MPKVVRSISLDPTDPEHREILAWWERQDNTSEAVRQLIWRDLHKGEGVTLEMIYSELQRIKAGAPVQEAQIGDVNGVAPEAANALDQLGL